MFGLFLRKNTVHFICLLLAFMSFSGECQINSIDLLKQVGSKYYLSSKYLEASDCFGKINQLYESEGNIEYSIDYENKSLSSLIKYDKKMALEASQKLHRRLENKETKMLISFELWYFVQDNIANTKSLNNQYEESALIRQKISDSIISSGRLEKQKDFFVSNQYKLCRTNEQNGLLLQGIINLESYLDILSTTSEKSKYFEKLAGLYRAIGNFKESNNYFFKCIEIVKTNSLEHAYYLNSIGNNFSKLMNPKLAIQFYLKLLDIREELFQDQDPKLGIVYHNLANMYKLIDKKEESISFYNKALSNYQLAYGEPSEEVGFVYNSLGNFYFDENKFNTTLSFYKRGLYNRQKTLEPNSEYLIHSYYNIANTHLNIGSIDSAKQFINYAKTFNPLDQTSSGPITNMENLGYLKDYAYSYWLAGKISFEGYKIEKDHSLLNNSKASYDKSVESYYKLLSIQDQEESKLPYVEQLKNSIIGSLNSQMIIDSLQKTKSFNTIYNLFEKSHNSQLFELVKNSSSQKGMLTEKDSIIYFLKYKRELDSLCNSDTTNYKHNTEQFLDLYLKIEHFKKCEKQSFDNFLDTDTSFLGYNKIKNQLAENNLILQFIVSPNTNQVFFFCFSDRWSDYGYLTSFESFYSMSQKFSQSIRKFELEEVKSNSKLMSDILKDALPPDLNKYNHLIIIPDGFLWHIPFDAISNPYNKSTYLIDRLSISTHLSCNLLLFETNNSNKYTYDFVGFAPFATTTPLDIYESIPSSGNEIIKAAEALEAIKFESICIKDTATNFTNFLEYSQKARILHFATHFDFIPGSSTQGLLLNSSTDQLNPECVEYQDILYSGSAPKLVILSACNSSSEIIQTKGEGPINLNRAFIMNGTKNIIYSINKINDKFSEEFYEIFYQSLVQGLDFGQAFQKTKRQIMKTSNYSHPFFWSGFQMISIL